MQWPPIMAWTSLVPYKGEKSFVAVNYGLEENVRWVDMVSVIDGDVFLRVSFKDLKDPSKWMPGWNESEMSNDQIECIHSTFKISSVHPSKDSGLPIPLDPKEHRAWFNESKAID